MTIALYNRIQIASDPFENPVRKTIRFSMYKKLDHIYSDIQMPVGYTVIPFDKSLLPAFSAVTSLAYVHNPELEYYPDLGTRNGCYRLIEEFTEMQGFRPDASFLVTWNNEPVAVVLARRLPGCVFGEIQFVAVAPRHRRRGLARILVTRAMLRLRDLQIPHASLHVNMSNRNAVRCFRRLGFEVNSTGLYGLTSGRSHGRLSKIG